MVSVYFVNKIGKPIYKIGITNNINRRLKEIQTGSDEPLVCNYCIRCETREEARGTEKEIHSILKQKKKEGEWFSLNFDDIDYLSFSFDLIRIGMLD